MTKIDQSLINQMRDMARRGKSVTAMFHEVQSKSADSHILDILAYFRNAFCLSLKEAKPICALSRSEGRSISDESLLEELVMPEIEKHRQDWDV